MAKSTKENKSPQEISKLSTEKDKKVVNSVEKQSQSIEANEEEHDQNEEIMAEDGEIGEEVLDMQNE